MWYGISLFWYSVPFERFGWNGMFFDLRFVPLERFMWYEISLLWQMVPIKRFRQNRMVFKLRFVPR